MIPAVAGLALQYGPALAKWLFNGRDADQGLIAQAADAVQAVTGTTDVAQAAAILADPAKGAELAVALGQIAAAREAAADAERTKRAQIEADSTANARAAGSMTPLIARNQVFLSWAITAAFCSMLFILLLRGAPQGNDLGGQLFLIGLGALGAAFQQVLQFFFGNSTSANTSNTLTAQIASRATISAPLDRQAAAEVARTPSPPGVTADQLNGAEMERKGIAR